MNTRLAPILALALAAGCDNAAAPMNADMATAAMPDLAMPATPDLAPATVPVTIRFAAEVGGQKFACGQTYKNVGKTAADYTVTDYRFYAHDFRLVDHTGREQKIALDQDGTFQLDDLALLDFEDGTNGCTAGTAAIHDAVKGRVPAGHYVGLRFTAGVPVEKNHLDTATAPSPLNLSSMEWVWQSGYKFIRIDGKSGATPYVLHLGSTGCAGPSPQQPPAQPCANANRFTVSFDAFDAATQVVVADVARVFADSDVTTNTANTPPGCMAGLTDPDCTAILPKLGLPFNQTPAEKQVFLSAR